MEILFGALVSVLTQWIKQSAFFKASQYRTLALVIVLSLVGAASYTYLVSINYWQSFLGILAIAGAIYTFIIQRFEAPATTIG